MVNRLHLLMQNNHAVPSFELLCLYLANSQDSIYHIPVVIRLYFLIQNNHMQLIVLLC